LERRRSPFTEGKVLYIENLKGYPKMSELMRNSVRLKDLK
jgi:hypothetical protein